MSARTEIREDDRLEICWVESVPHSLQKHAIRSTSGLHLAVKCTYICIILCKIVFFGDNPFR